VQKSYAAWGVAMPSVSPTATRQGSLELAVAPAAVRTARHWTAKLLAQTNPPHDLDLIDSVVLLVSELVTNAVYAAAAVPGAPPAKPRVWLSVAGSADLVRIEVHDSACALMPVQRHRDAYAESGRGLAVMTALASDWGWHPDQFGKVVWCELRPHLRLTDAGCSPR